MVLRITICLLLLSSCDSSSDHSTMEPYLDYTLTGKDIYGQNCSICHGDDGTLGNSGSKDITKSRLDNEELRDLIINGRKAMPPFMELVAKDGQLDSLIQYVQKMKK